MFAIELEFVLKFESLAKCDRYLKFLVSISLFIIVMQLHCLIKAIALMDLYLVLLVCFQRLIQEV